MTGPAHGYTPSGKPISDDDLNAYAAEAEAGYPAARLGPRPPGRPLLGDAPSRSLSVRFTPAQREALRAEADRRGTDIATVVRDAVQAHLRQVAARTRSRAAKAVPPRNAPAKKVPAKTVARRSRQGG